MFSTLKSAMNRVSTGFLPPPGGPIAPIYRMSFRDCTVDTVRVSVRASISICESVSVSIRVSVSVIVVRNGNRNGNSSSDSDRDEEKTRGI
jgi:hypothetical protein